HIYASIISLHDALPISGFHKEPRSIGTDPLDESSDRRHGGRDDERAFLELGAEQRPYDGDSGSHQHADLAASTLALQPESPSYRSEEHTSELQSHLNLV